MNTETTEEQLRLDDMMSLPKFCERYSDICSLSRARWLIFNRKTNGIEEAGAVIKTGGRWLVVLPRFKAWLMAGGGE